MSFQHGDILLEDYRIEEEIGQGAFAVVYKAFHKGLKAYRALKVLRRVTPGLGSTIYEDYVNRFKLEAQLGARLNHPNIIQVHDFKQVGQDLILIMEYVAGGNLRERIDNANESGTLIPIEEAINIAVDVAEGLSALHEKDIVHRDLKPSNILFDGQGHEKVADLGLAQIPGGPSMRHELSNPPPHPGTPAYMSPEHSDGAKYLTSAADVYALGLVLFEILTGVKYKNRKPGTRARELRKDVPNWLDALITKMTSESNEKRPWDGSEAFKILREGKERGFEYKISTNERWRIIPKIVNAVNSVLQSHTSLTRIMGIIGIILVLYWGGSFVISKSISTINEVIGYFQYSPTPRVVPKQEPTVNLADVLSGSIYNGDLIAFTSDRSGNNDIYLTNPDSGNVTQLTYSTADDRVPSWSPDGEEIAYQSNTDGDYEIYIINLTSRQIRQVTDNSCNDYAPFWSPDQKWFVYYSDCDDDREIFLIDINGSNRSQLTVTGGINNWFPTWSPDGRWITFSANRSGNYQVFTMEADGSSPHALVEGCVSMYSPDSRRIVFNQYCLDDGDIYIVDSDGSNLQQITYDCNCSNPAWSSDGNKIIFQRQQGGNYDIWIMDADGSNMQRIIGGPSRDATPVWQPIQY